MEATSAASFHVAPKARRASRPCPALRWRRSATTQHVAAEASVAFTPGQKGSKRCARLRLSDGSSPGPPGRGPKPPATSLGLGARPPPPQHRAHEISRQGAQSKPACPVCDISIKPWLEFTLNPETVKSAVCKACVMAGKMSPELAPIAFDTSHYKTFSRGMIIARPNFSAIRSI